MLPKRIKKSRYAKKRKAKEQKIKSALSSVDKLCKISVSEKNPSYVDEDETEDDIELEMHAYLNTDIYKLGVDLKLSLESGKILKFDKTFYSTKTCDGYISTLSYLLPKYGCLVQDWIKNRDVLMLYAKRVTDHGKTTAALQICWKFLATKCDISPSVLSCRIFFFNETNWRQSEFYWKDVFFLSHSSRY
jgi:hypothetical protein